MTQNFIQPKGSLNTQVNVNGLQNQLAQMFANQQLQGQAQASNQYELRQTVNDLVKSKLLQEIETPKFTTIQDVFKAPTGQKVEAFGSYLNTPTAQNAIGNIISLISGGKYYSTPGDSYTNYLQNDMSRRQMQALAEQKEQNDLAQAMNSAFLQQDIADMNDKRARELAKEQQEFLKQEHALDREFRRQENAANRAQQLQISKMIHSGGGGGYGKPLSDTQVKDIEAIQGNITNLTDIENRYNDKKYKDAFGIKGQTRATLAEKHPILYAPFDNEINLVRQDLDMLRQKYGKAIEGGRMSDADRAFYRNVLMAQNLSYDNFKEGVRRLRESEQKSLERKLNNYALQGKNTYGYADGYLNNNTQPNNTNNSNTMQVGGYTIKVKQ